MRSYLSWQAIATRDSSSVSCIAPDAGDVAAGRARARVVAFQHDDVAMPLHGSRATRAGVPRRDQLGRGGMPPPTRTTSAVSRQRHAAPVRLRRDEVTEADRAQRRPRGRQARRSVVRRRSDRVQANAWRQYLPWHGPVRAPGPALDELRIAVAGRHLGMDLVRVDVLAEADECPADRLRHRRRPSRGRAHDRQPRHGRATVRVEDRREDAVAPLDGGAGGKDQVEVRGAIGEDDEVDRLVPPTPVDVDDRTRDATDAEDPPERRRRDLPYGRLRPRRSARRRPPPAHRRRRPAAVAPRAGRRPRHEPVDEPCPHHARPVGAADRRHAFVRARCRDDGRRPDRPERLVVDRRDDPVVPADRARAVQDPHASDPSPAGAPPRRPPRPSATRSPRPAPPQPAAATPDRPPPTTRTSTSSSRATRVPRRGWTADRQPAPTAEAADHVEVQLAECTRPQETMVVERRRDQARPHVEQAEDVALDGRPGVLAARDQAFANGTWHDLTLGRPSTSHSHQPH